MSDSLYVIIYCFCILISLSLFWAVSFARWNGTLLLPSEVLESMLANPRLSLCSPRSPLTYFLHSLWRRLYPTVQPHSQVVEFGLYLLLHFSPTLLRLSVFLLVYSIYKLCQEDPHCSLVNHLIPEYGLEWYPCGHLYLMFLQSVHLFELSLYVMGLLLFLIVFQAVWLPSAYLLHVVHWWLRLFYSQFRVPPIRWPIYPRLCHSILWLIKHY